MSRAARASLWLFEERGQQIAETHRFREPVTRAEAREHILWWYRWERLPRGCSLDPVFNPWWRTWP